MRAPVAAQEGEWPDLLPKSRSISGLSRLSRCNICLLLHFDETVLAERRKYPRDGAPGFRVGRRTA